MPTHRPVGLAMPDVLVALVLMAIALAVACGTLIQSLRATRGALLTTRALDLANDLSEQLHVTEPDSTGHALEAWRVRLPAVLPVEGMVPERIAEIEAVEPVMPSSALSGLHQLILRWHAQDGSLRELRLPLLLPSDVPT